LVDYLPVILTGGSRMVSEFPRFDTANVIAELRGSLDTPVAVANNKLRDGAIQIMWDEMDGSPMPLIAMHGVGSGRVTAGDRADERPSARRNRRACPGSIAGFQ
jgi:hypothetical protein